MKEIYVLNEEGGLQKISAGVESYEELLNAPIATYYNNVKLIGSVVEIIDNKIILTDTPDHKWSEVELIDFCKYADTGRYDIMTESRGYESLMIDATNKESRKYRRSNVSSDEIWIATSADDGMWKAVTDTDAEKLIVKFLNEEEIPLSMVVGDPLLFKFYYYSTRGTATIRATFITAKGSEIFTVGTATSGNNVEIDLGKYIKDGYNEISIKFENTAASEVVAYKAINGVKAEYQPTFNKYQPYKSNIMFPYSCSSSSKKIIHFDITNAKGEITHLETTHSYQNASDAFVQGNREISAEYFSHGINTITTYMVAIGNNEGQEYEMARTAPIVYEIPFLTTEEPILMVYVDEWDGLIQYASLNIPYYVWSMNPGNLESVKFSLKYSDNDELIIDYSHKEDEAGAITSYLQFNTALKWLITSLPTSCVNGDSNNNRGITFQIEGLYNEKPINSFLKTDVYIKPSSSTMQPVENYKFNFNAVDFELNATAEGWKGTGTSEKYLTFENFNLETDGLKSDNKGNQFVHFSSKASAHLYETVNPVFGTIDTPFTLEFCFKVDKSAADKPIIKYYNKASAGDKNGLTIYPNRASLQLVNRDEPIDIYYNSGERIHLTYVAFNKQITDIDLDDKDTQNQEVKTFALIYLNGILSNITQLNSSTIKYPESAGAVEFNTSNIDFDLYAFRGYNVALTSSQVLQNYISTFGNAKEKEDMHFKNSLYDYSAPTGVPGESKISFSKVIDSKTIPCYVVVCDRLPRSKDYVDCLGIYYEMEGKNFVEPGGWVKKMNQDLTGIPKATTYYYYRERIMDEETNEQKRDEYGNLMFTDWVRNKPIEVGGQGTSSMKYPRHNLKFKHNKNNKFYIKGHTDGPDRTFTFKADYMDSSGANNIGNAQILDDALLRDKWINTPIADTSKHLRLNLDGFPVAVFWCKSKDLKGGVIQDLDTTNVVDHKGNPLFDKVTPVDGNDCLGVVEPLDPVYLGTFNFNYDKKAKALLGWDEDIFQGFEFRGNSSKCNLFNGFESLINFASLTDGFEWRWTYCSDWVDDYYEGQLGATIAGGYSTAKDDENKVETTDEAGYLYDRYVAEKPKEYTIIEPYNAYYIERNGEKLQLFFEKDGKLLPINYVNIHPNNANWTFEFCEGIGHTEQDVCLEYGVKWGEKDGKMSFLYQPPYGFKGKFTEAYADGSHYYKFDWNPEHEFKFELNTENAKFYDENGVLQDYHNDNNYWTALAPIEQIKAYKYEYVVDENGDYVFDNGDKHYHAIASYPDGIDFNGTDEDGNKLFADERYIKIEEYLSVTPDDEIITWDYMRHIMKNWCYVNEAVARCSTDINSDAYYVNILDSTKKSTGTVNNGNGLFIWDALTNYMAASIVTGLCDNFAKNMFMHSYDEGKTWSPAWYDMDTCFGLNNQGTYSKPYDLDFMDVDDLGARGFNGSDSKLWQLLYNHKTNNWSDFRAVYRELRKQDKISYDKIMNVLYDQNIAYKSESLYNANAIYRYMEPSVWHDNYKLEAAQGNRLSLLEYWNKHREIYLDSAYDALPWTSDRITLRPNHTSAIEYKLTPSVNMYVGMNFNSGNEAPSAKSPTKVLAGESYTIKSKDNVTNENTFIYGASYLWEVGDLSYANSEEYSLGKATNLKKIKIGDSVHYPTIETALSLSNSAPYVNLTEIDLTNVKFKSGSRELNLTYKVGDENEEKTTLNLTPSLSNLYLDGTNITTLTIHPYTPIEKLRLPSTLLSLTFNNLHFITEFKTPNSFPNVGEVDIVRCPGINQADILSKIDIDKVTKLTLDNLQIDEENAIERSYMEKLMSLNQATLNGSVYVKSPNEGDITKYNEFWASHGGLKVEWFRIYEEDAILGVEGEGESLELNRILAVQGITSQIAYNDTALVYNEYDSTWYGGLEIVEDEDGRWLKVPPFYTSYTTDENGVVKGRRISQYEIEKNTYKMNPIFIDKYGNPQDVYIACYLASDKNGAIVNATKATPAEKTYLVWTTAVNALNANPNNEYIYELESLWTRQLLQDLFAIEFATTNSTSIFKGNKITTTGTTDGIEYMNAIARAERVVAEADFKYRGLENLWNKNKNTLLKGAITKEGYTYINKNSNASIPEGFPENQGDWIKLNNQLTSGTNYIKFLRVEQLNDNSSQIVLPYRTTTSAAESCYKEQLTGPVWNKEEITYIASRGADSGKGLWSLNANISSSDTLYARLVKTKNPDYKTQEE